MPDFFYKSFEYSLFIVPPLACAWAWWSWIRAEKSSIRPWRRVFSELSLGFLSAGIGLATFSISYLYTHLELVPNGFPPATINSLELGAIVGLIALLTAFFAKSQTRVALLLSSIGLMMFLYALAISP
jgi:hypothetical protein